MQRPPVDARVRQVDVQDAPLEALLAQLQELNSLVAYNLAIAELHRVTGTGLEANRIDLVVTDGAGSPR